RTPARAGAPRERLTAVAANPLPPAAAGSAAATPWSPAGELAVLWITAGLSCDGDTVAMTAATQPSIQDLVRGATPWAPGLKLHNPLLAREAGDDFLAVFRRAAAGDLGPFILVVEGSVPDESNKPEGTWAALGTDPVSGQPIATCEWIDRLAP